MTADTIAKIDGKILCGADGGKVPITKIEFVKDRRGKEGEEFWAIEIGGVAHNYLVNPNDPADGSEPLPEPVPVLQSHDLEKDDSHQFLASINSQFGLTGDDALVDDGGDWHLRFTEDGEKSVVAKIKDVGAYFRAKAKNNAEVAAKFGNAFFFNFHNVKERKAATTAALAEIRALLDAKKAKKAADDKAKADANAALFG